LGFRVGSSARAVETLVSRERETTEAKNGSDAERKTTPETDDQIRQRLGISETEYRLNWMPLGGYVKMLGQDDLHANAEQTDPRAYNMKPIPQRMVIISAGVIMNVILAAVGFFVLFLIGFDVPPPVVGAVMPLSPAQHAGILVGDRILEIDGRPQRDFTKIQLNVALMKEGEAVPVKVQHPNGQIETLSITPAHPEPDSTGFLALGIMPSEELQGVSTDKRVMADFEESKPLGMADEFAVEPGERIEAINGQSVGVKDYYKLYDAMQASAGNPVTITVSDSSGQHDKTITPEFVEPFTGPLNFAGLVPRAMVVGFTPESKAHGPLQAGDAIESVTVKGDTLLHPTRQAMIEMVTKPGVEPDAVDIAVMRKGQLISAKEVPTIDLDNSGWFARLLIKVGIKTERRGLGVQLDHDANSAVIGTVIKDSAADRAGITVTNSGDVTVTRIGDEPVKSFRDIKRLVGAAKPGKINFTVKTDGGEKNVPVELSQDDISTAANETYRGDLLLHELSEPRKTRSFATAALWGIEETRDLIVQFYITLQRMIIGHSVPAKNMMGPLGIVTTGAAFANKGIDNLIWFLAMISANLAVVNFLPIPIVDGGLFVFLIIEKFQGKPISPRVQSIAQLVGIALILSVFIFVTIQDIHRL
jgi:regulator of sigma E protease